MTRRFSLAAGALLLVAIVGCSVTRTLPRRDLNYESSTRIPLKVELYLASDEALRKARWQTGSGQTIIVEMGDALTAGTEQLARALFADVVVTSSVMMIVRRRHALHDGVPARDRGRVSRGRRRSYVARDAGAAGTPPHCSSCSRRHGLRDRRLRGRGGWEFASWRKRRGPRRPGRPRSGRRTGIDQTDRSQPAGPWSSGWSTEWMNRPAEGAERPASGAAPSPPCSRATWRT